ncbi:MAG: hypothetical protein AAB738_00815 [Patescibacteria group bacterium]
MAPKLKGYRSKGAYCLSFLNFIREQSRFGGTSPLEASKKSISILHRALPQSVNGGALATSPACADNFGGQAKVRYLARRSRNRACISKIKKAYHKVYKKKEPPACAKKIRAGGSR